MGVPYEPEFSRSYEIGVKTDSAGGRLRTNAAIFFTDFEDMHGVVTLCNDAGVCSGAVQNAAKAEIKGLELELAAIPTERLELTLGLGYVDPKYVEIDPAATDISLDSEFPLAPDWTIVGGAQYRVPLGSGGEVTFRADANYKSGHVLGLGPASIENGAVTLVDARLAYAPQGRRWDVAAYGKNLTDEHYFQSGVAFIPIAAGFDYAVFNRPREWGVTFNYYAGD